MKPSIALIRVLGVWFLAFFVAGVFAPVLGRADDLDDDDIFAEEPADETDAPVSVPSAPVAGASSATSDLAYIKGRQYALEGKYEEAAPLLEKALAQAPEDPFLSHQLGEVYLRLGDFERAESLAAKAVEKDGQNLEYRATLAGIYAGMKRYDDAKGQYRKILEINPKNRRAPLFIGIIEAEQGNYSEGIRILTKAIESNGDSYMAYFYRAKIYLESNDVANAKKDLNTCLVQKPAFVEAGTALGLLHERLGETEEAIAVYNKIQGNGRFKKRLAQLYLQKNEFEKALQELIEYEKVEADDYTARVKIALIFFEMKRYDEARARFEAILKEQPQADVRFYLAAIYEEQKDLKRALAEFKKVNETSSFYKESMLHVGFLYRETGRIKEGLTFAAGLVKRNPGIPEFYDLHASLLEFKKDFQGALRVVTEGLKRFPSEERLLYFQGALFDKVGKREAALENMRKIIAANGKNAHALNFLGYTYAEQGENLEEAESLIKRALELRPEDGYIMDSLGWVYFKQGKLDEALAQLEAAKKQQPEEPVILEHLGDVLLKKREFEQASQYYRKAQEISAAKKDKETSKKLEQKMVALEKERTPSSKSTTQ